MTVLEEKRKKVISNINNIDDEFLLDFITEITDLNSENVIYNTSFEQKLSISEGREQIYKGECYSNEQVEMEIDQLLN
jgi:hypothetical protein